jgi:Chalcone isomerase-like
LTRAVLTMGWRRRNLIMGLAFFAGGCGAALAQEAPAPAAHAVAEARPSAPLYLRGQGVFKFWGLEVYRARLWTTSQFLADDPFVAPLALELEYLRPFTGRAIAKRSIEEMRRVGRFSEEQAQRWTQRMTQLFPDVGPGHTLRGLHQPGTGAVFEHNGRQLGEVADTEFSRLFFGIWLSPNTSGPELRKALIAAQRNGG